MEPYQFDELNNVLITINSNEKNNTITIGRVILEHDYDHGQYLCFEYKQYLTVDELMDLEFNNKIVRASILSLMSNMGFSSIALSDIGTCVLNTKRCLVSVGSDFVKEIDPYYRWSINAR